MFFVQTGRALRKCNFRTPDHLYLKALSAAVFHIFPELKRKKKRFASLFRFHQFRPL
jgi:hypothetical protein